MTAGLQPCPLKAGARICSHSPAVVLECGCSSCPYYLPVLLADPRERFYYRHAVNSNNRGMA